VSRGGDSGDRSAAGVCRDPRIGIPSGAMNTTESGRDSRRVIRVAHSPDSDDAFMFYGLASGEIDTAELAF